MLFLPEVEVKRKCWTKARNWKYHEMVSEDGTEDTAKLNEGLILFFYFFLFFSFCAQFRRKEQTLPWPPLFTDRLRRVYNERVAKLLWHMNHTNTHLTSDGQGSIVSYMISL